MIPNILDLTEFDKEFLHALKLAIVFSFEIFENWDSIFELKAKRMDKIINNDDIFELSISNDS